MTAAHPRGISYCRQRFAAGQTEEAEEALRELLRVEPSDPDLLNLLLAICERSGKPEGAIEAFRSAAARKDDARLHCGLGRALRAAGRDEDALAPLRRAIELDPADCAAYANMSAALEKLGRFEEMARTFQEALSEPHPREARATLCACLGVALTRLERHEEALMAHEKALEAARGTGLEADMLNDVCNALSAVGRFEERLPCYERALELEKSAKARTNVGLTRLLLGDLPGGFRDYESRLELDGTNRASLEALASTRWDGGEISGKRILLYHEQGLGDTMQFVRYAPLVAKRGGRVTLCVQAPLKRLLSDLPGVAEVLVNGDSLPAVDLHCAITSLPLAFGTTLDTVPQSIPYLHADEALRESWRKRLNPAAGLKVGLVWAGNPKHTNDQNRSIAPELLRPLLETQGTTFYSLQVGRPEDLARLGTPDGARDVSPFLTDFAETAAALAELDLLITVDTSVAHLAGAMGIETWVLLPYSPDWRWLLQREDTPWYPTMRLFRQPKYRDWETAIRQVQTELRRRAACKRARLEAGGAATPATSRQPIPCKICGGDSPLFGVVDFHKSCIEAQGKRLSLSGLPVYYRRCAVCGFLFTDSFDGWPEEEFERRIYNTDYAVVDPDYVALRPMANAQTIAQVFAGGRESLRLLDYGGGNGVLARLLREQGFQAESYDPFPRASAYPEGRFDLITCFEVMEHVPSPEKTVGEMVSLLEEEGAILFSTLLQPDNFDQLGMNWWYAGPRNGHISLHSRNSMVLLFQKFGMRTASFSDGLHIAFRQVPRFAAHLFGAQA